VITNSSLIEVRSGSLLATSLVNESGRTLVVSGTGNVSASGIKNHGTILLQDNLVPISGGGITNQGVIRGTGIIGVTVINQGSITVNGNDLQFDAPGANNIQVSSVADVVSAVVFLGSYNGGTPGRGRVRGL
jgi:hypothetical protein